MKTTVAIIGGGLAGLCAGPLLALCGSETSATEPGVMAGAARSAQRAVLEVSARLGRTRA